MLLRKVLYGCVLMCFLMPGFFQSSWALDNGLALTPPMGWNSYNKFGGKVTQDQVLAVAKAFATDGLKEAGYRYIVIDYCWADSLRNSAGEMNPRSAKFPKGMKFIGDSVHALGLKFGMYACPTITTCCTNEAGSYQHETKDAQAFANWGVDYMKYDWCGVQSKEDKLSLTPQQIITRYCTMRDAIKATKRDMVFAMCEKGQKSKIQPATWSDSVGHMWRIRGDINASWDRIFQQVDTDEPLAQYAGPTKGWNDPDMLEVGNGSLTDTENKTHFSMWCILAAPLMMGNDPANMTAAVKTVLTNKEVIDIDQDSLGKQGIKIKDDGDHEVWVKQLKGGDRAVVLLNRNATQAANMSINWTDSLIKWPATTNVKIRDLWLKKDSNASTGYSGSVAPHGVTMLRLSNGIVEVAKALDALPSGRTVSIRKTVQGFVINLPNSNTVKKIDIVDMQGKILYKNETFGNLFYVQKNILGRGMNIIRVNSNNSRYETMFFNAR